jgi:amino-acid N-acetyltransferase
MSESLPLLVRTAQREDLPFIEALLRDCALPTDGVAPLLLATPDQFVVATDPHHTLVAVAGVEGQGAHGLLRSVGVHPGWRADGVGGRLVQRLLERADADGRVALYLLTTTADQYFPRFGFVRIERNDVPADIAATVEFTSACPASAICMVRYRGGTHG